MHATQPRVKIWLTAIRPFAYPASVTAVFFGTAVAFYQGASVHGLRFVLTLIGVVCFHTAANLLNDRFDFQRGLDRRVHPGSGAVVRGWLTPASATRAAAVLLILGAGIGMVLFIQTGWPVLALGAAGTLIVLAYTRSGFCLKYTAMGDAAIFISFGLLPVFGAFWVQAQRFSLVPVLWSIPLAFYTVAILHANNWRDLESDPDRGCRTVASSLGEKGSAAYYKFLVLGPMVWIAAAGISGWFVRSFDSGPVWVVLCLLVLPKALKLVRIDRIRDPDQFVMLDALTARTQLGFGLLLTLAFLLGGI